MRLRRLVPRARPLAVVALAAALVATIVVAWRQPGFAQVPPLRDDRAAWVVNDARLLVGRVNTRIGELDSAALTSGVSEVVQDPISSGAGAVAVVDQAEHELQLLDTRSVTFGTRVRVPDDAGVRLGGGTLAVTDPADGRLWVGTADAVETVDARAVPETATVGSGAVVAVSLDGTAVAVAPGAHSVLAVRPGAEPLISPVPGGALSLGGLDPGGSLQVTAVGRTPVLLDGGDGTLRLPFGRVVLPDPVGAVLQQPGPAADAVVVATPRAVLSVGLSDGAVTALAELPAAAQGAAAPVVLGDCVYAAWTGQGMSVCAGRPAVRTELAGAGSGPLAFQHRGSAVVLTDHRTGRSWVADAGYRAVDNWADVAPPDPSVDDTTTVEDPTTNSDLPRLPPDCTAMPVGAPTAADDEFGVRADRATVLRVLDNDPSVDCTSVVISAVTPLSPESGQVAVVAGGSALQVTPAPGAVNLPPIEYTVDNGAGGTATARVLVAVVPPEITSPPQRVRRSAVTVEENGTATYTVLDDYFSPSGDDLFLVSASTDGGDAVSFRPDGTVTYRNAGGGAGTDRRVEFVVSDGVRQATGTLQVAIATTDSTTPVAYPVFASAVVGSTATAAPLRSVSSGSLQPVVIRAVQPQAGSEGTGTRVQPDGTVQITAPGGGSYYFTFEAATGGRAVTGVLRADFVEPNAQSRAVVPMTDVAYLPAGGTVLIDPLANDTDPDGQGLAVRDIALPADAPIAASVLDLHLVQVSSPRAVERTVAFDYAVFDGASTQRGQVRVVPVPAAQQIPPPVAAPIASSVRAGDAVSIDVERFASSQDGTAVTAELDPVQVDALPGRAFSTGEQIRYFAPVDQPPGRVTFSYVAVAASSTALQPVRTVSTVTITVTDPDPARNGPPAEPPPAIARVFAGGSISISAPLDGIDPDGDWVTLQSLAQPDAPLGEVAISGADTLSYTAFGTAGVDRLRYIATDTYGATVTGVITVLVVEPGDSARPPVAPDIAVAVRPGASIRIDPLSVVVDPGGQQVTLGTPPFVASRGLDVQVDGQSLIVTAPPEPTVATLRYSVINAKRLQATGSVEVTVSPDAPLAPPMASDVFVRPADLSASARTVDVDVSGSVLNRSGRNADLVVSVDPLSAAQAAMAAPQVVRVTVTASRQIVAYRVTDRYGATAIAFIVVPPQAQLVGPQLLAGAGPIRLNAGESVEVAIADFVTVGGGGEPLIAASPPLRATQGSAIRTSGTTLTVSAPTTAGGSAAVYVPIEGGSGVTTVLAVPVEIAPRLVPPPLLDSTELAVEAGTAGTVDLAALTTTADELQRSSLRYSIGQAPDGLQATIQNGVVTVAVRADVPRGTSAAVPLEVRDGDGREGKATLTVTVTGSRLPLPTVPDQQISQGRGGVEVAVDMLTGSSDPVGLGLAVVSAAVAGGIGGIAAGPTVDGSTIRLTPAVGFVGEIVIAVGIADGTRDPERVVTATLRVSIQDRPSAPGTPGVVDGTTTATSVQLVWEPADANGSAITGYTVQGGGVSRDCPGSQTSCVVDGLVPGRPYVFVVTATNAVGSSNPSPPSTAIVPDAAPAPPAPPAVQYVQRGTLRVDWTPPAGDFTPVTGSAVQVLRNGAPAQVIEGAASPLLLDGLDSAAAYSFQVRASNRAGTGDWSPASAAVIPSGVPAAPTGLTADFVYDGARRTVDIRWAAPQDDGGEPVQGYRLLIDDVETASGGADFLAASVNIGPEQPISVTVLARNARGDGPAAAPVTVAPFVRPSAVGGLAVTPEDGGLTASWAPAPSPGRPVADYQYQLDGGAWVGAGAATSARIAPLNNGTSYQVRVRACNGEQGYPEEVRCGPASEPVAGRPFGGLAAPTITAELVERWGSAVRVSWTIPDGNGRAVASRTVAISGVGEVDADAGSWTGDIGFGQRVSATVEYCVADPGECSTATAESPATATPVALGVVGPAPLTGTCRQLPPQGGAWIDQPGCPAGDWAPVGQQVQAMCATGGPAYPQAPPPGGVEPPPPPAPDIADWVLAADGFFYRAPALDSPPTALPPC